MNTYSRLADERIASIREIQKNPSQALRGITRVTRGSKTIGFFFSNEEFEDFVESLEAAESHAFVQLVAQARRDVKKKDRWKSLKAVAKEYGV